MKIIELHAENIKKIRAIEIKPTGHLVKISGRNGSGKTSTLDSIWWALAGTKNVQSAPIRKGATKAMITLDLGQIIVTRRFTEKGSTLTVENAEGARYQTPQRMLDDLIGALSFDPLAFSRMEPKAQFDEMKSLVPLEIDADQLDGLNRRDFEERTEINRDAKAKRAQADGIAVPADLPAEPIDATALMDQMASAADSNALIERRRASREKAAADVVDCRAGAQQAEDGLPAMVADLEREVGERVAEFKRQIDALVRLTSDAVAQGAAAIAAARKKIEELAAELRSKADETQAKLDAAEPLPAPIDVAALRGQVDRANAANAGIEKRARKAALVAEAEQLEARAASLTETIEARKAAKAEAIAKAPMPVPGLSFGDGVILYNGIPFDQASSAEQLRVSVAIAMAANPELRVLRIREGSFLDKDGLALIAKMAAENDYQCWIELVSDTDKIGIVIEDGQVVAVNEDAPADPQPAKAAAPEPVGSLL